MPCNEKHVALKLREKNPCLLLKQTPDKFGTGVPDRLGLLRGTTFVFVAELKFIKQLPKHHCKVGLKRQQARWMSEWKDNGGNAFLIVGVKDKVAIFKERFNKIFSVGIDLQDFNLINYEDVAAELQKV